MAPSVGNRINIKRVVTRKGAFGRLKEERLHVQVAYSGEGSEADKSVIHYIRTKLELDDAHNVDSARFYDGAEVDDWVAEYRRACSGWPVCDAARKFFFRKWWGRILVSPLIRAGGDRTHDRGIMRGTKIVF
jgi:hypothetical protein